MLIGILLALLLVGVLYGRMSKNKDLIKKNNKTIVDTANVNNAKKYYHNDKAATISLLVGIAMIAFCILCEFTDIETSFLDAISTDFVETTELSKKLYLIPVYYLLAREIIIQVKISEYLQKFYNDKEPEEKITMEDLKKIDIKKILYKPVKKEAVAPEDPNKVVRTNEINEILDIEPIENQNK